jgi:hypothetical protein
MHCLVMFCILRGFVRSIACLDFCDGGVCCRSRFTPVPLCVVRASCVARYILLHVSVSSVRAPAVDGV